MNIVTIWSESHRPLMDRFRSSFERVEPRHTFEAIEIPQYGSGRYDAEGFREAMIEKVRIIQSFTVEGGPVFYVDCDVVWLRPFVEDLAELLKASEPGLLCQQHGAGDDRWPSAGMMAFRPTGLMAGLWNRLMETTRKFHDDECALRDLWLSGGVRCDFLPHRFWTPGIEARLWTHGDPLNLPADAVCLHASWTVGIENKLAMMDEAERVVLS